MKNGYTLFDPTSTQKLEITLDGLKDVKVELGDYLNWEQAQEFTITYSDFREFMKGVAAQFFDISGEQ